MQNKQLIIFDMDGTLIDSGNVISNTINFVRTNLGLDLIQKDELLKNLNNPDINSAKYFYGTNEFTPEQTKLFQDYYDKHCISDIALYDGILEMLDELNGKFSMTIATNASVEFANKMIEHLSIHHYFDFVIGANCVENPKPHPDMLYKTLRTLNYDVKSSLLIGDSLKDKKAAQEASMDNILVNWGFSDHSNEDSVSCTDSLTKIILDTK